MKLHVLSENLQKKIPFLNHAVSSKSQLSILLHFLIEAKRGVLTISSTDLEIGIKTIIPANIEEEGSVVVSARKFSDLINSLPQEKITLQTTETVLEVKGYRTKSVFQTTTKEEFPALYEELGEELVRLKNEELSECITPVSFAASIDSTRPELSGVLVQKEKTGFLLVATDGYRLSIKHFAHIEKKDKKPEEDEELSEKPILVPARLFKEVLLMKEEGEVTIYVSYKNNQIAFSQGDTVLVGRLIEAEFPNYQKIIPSDFESNSDFDVEEMEKAVKICSVFARESANIIKLTLQENKIVVSANAPSVGENTVETETKLIGEENEIAFNGRYLLDMLANVKAEEMTLQMTGPFNPGLFKIKGDESYIHIIMPIRVQG